MVPKNKKPAPKGNPALEAFINACTNDFVNPNHRRRIKDNLTKNQRIAIQELSNLPLTNNAACRYADKSGNTVITDLNTDDEQIKEKLLDPEAYQILPTDPTAFIMEKCSRWAQKWSPVLTKEIVNFVTGPKNHHPGKCKPLIKTHKDPPYPIRLLLTGCGTPIQPLSQFVQQAIRHLTKHLTYQIQDTKAFLQKIDRINEEFAPLPQSAVIIACDVKNLYPSVDNTMGVPATQALLEKHPNPDGIPTPCILEALQLCLDLNACMYTSGDGSSFIAKPSQGVAMGPCHACDYVDVFMNELDQKLIDTSPVPLLTSLKNPPLTDEHNSLNWSRFRDDGITILPNEKDIQAFQNHLQQLCPPKIEWTFNQGKELNFLDLKIKLQDGYIQTTIETKSCHNYLPPNSCHPKSTFKGLISGLGTKLRINCSENHSLEKAKKAYTHFLQCSGWKKKNIQNKLNAATKKDRHTLIHKKKPAPRQKIPWITTHDPRNPSKNNIIQRHLNILYSDKRNTDTFPPGSIIAAEKRRRNLAEMYKPTVPRRFVLHGPAEEPGFFPCSSKCDFCYHSDTTKSFTSQWDGRCWKIRKHLTCKTPNIIYMLQCKIHPDAVYIGSTIDIKPRWRNHKSDFLRKQTHKCGWSAHSSATHPDDNKVTYTRTLIIDQVNDPSKLIERETWWQANVGTIFVGLNSRHQLLQQY